MYSGRHQPKRTAHAPAKLNLYLEILRRRSDGFHELETLMVPVALADTLTFAPSDPPQNGSLGDIRLDVRASLPSRSYVASETVPLGPENLVVQALERLRERSGCRHGADIELVKRIPSAAGMGGASSDAAAALRLANRAWGLHWDDRRLAEIAAEIGSDVPFFLSGGPAICRGKGEKVQRLWGLPCLHFVVVKPPIELKTADVYQAHDGLADTIGKRVESRAREIASLISGRQKHAAKEWMQNRLQAAAAALSPCVQRLREAFDRLDCVAHQLSGSGSAYFGLCRNRQHARRLRSLLTARQLGLVYATRSNP